MEIKGDKYLEDLKTRMHNGLIKVVTGIRRCGKSYLVFKLLCDDRHPRVDCRLDRKGHEVTEHLEYDFAANLGSEQYCIQSAYALPDAAKREQESESLKRIDDNFKKIVLVKEVTNPYHDERGVITMGLFNFLLDPGSLKRV